MNDLGWTLLGLAVRVAVLLGPALVLQGRAARFGAGRGGWVAAWSLGLVVMLELAAFGPRIGPDRGPIVAPVAAAAPAPGPAGAGAGVGVESTPAAGLGRAFDWRAVWDRLGRRAIAPARLVRPWGGAVAAVLLGGMAVALIRLAVGLGAIASCRRRGGRADDPALLGLVADLRASLGVRRPVEVRVVADLATAATAGWLRPVLLLPTNWADWTPAERRAVVAHELAHVARGDYATGLLGRVAVALNAYHPLVWWMDARLRLEQELAADALAARVAGGRGGYLVALAGLALKQDERSQHGLARAFLPARGTLIRRIAMLKLDEKTDRSPRTTRLATAGALLALAALAASWRGPALARAGDELANSVPEAGPAADPVPGDRPFDAGYVPDSANCLVAIRPAALLRRPGGDRLDALIRELAAALVKDFVAELHVDPDRPGALKLDARDIESLVLGVTVAAIKPGIKGHEKPMLHSLQIGNVLVRTRAPFDWPAYFRQWRLIVAEIREDTGVAYFQVDVPNDPAGEMRFYFAMPDDRTLVVNPPETLRQQLRRPAAEAPAQLFGTSWDLPSRGLLAVAFDNRGDRFATAYDRKINDPEDAAVLGLLAGVDRWLLCIVDAPKSLLRAEIVARNLRAFGAVARTTDAVAALGRAKLADKNLPDSVTLRLCRSFLANFRVESAGPDLVATSHDFGDLEAIVAAVRAEFFTDEPANPPASPGEAARPVEGGKP